MNIQDAIYEIKSTVIESNNTSIDKIDKKLKSPFDEKEKQQMKDSLKQWVKTAVENYIKKCTTEELSFFSKFIDTKTYDQAMRACAYDGVVYTQEYIDKEIATCLKSESSKELNKRMEKPKAIEMPKEISQPQKNIHGLK